MKTKCAVCGGATEKKSVTIDERHNGQLVIFEDVEAKVCGSCGEIWLSSEVLKKMDGLRKQKQPIGKLEVPVWSLKKTA
jgi:YgiT-type zinc finger domain-containing protein